MASTARESPTFAITNVAPHRHASTRHAPAIIPLNGVRGIVKIRKIYI